MKTTLSEPVNLAIEATRQMIERELFGGGQPHSFTFLDMKANSFHRKEKTTPGTIRTIKIKGMFLVSSGNVHNFTSWVYVERTSDYWILNCKSASIGGFMPKPAQFSWVDGNIFTSPMRL